MVDCRTCGVNLPEQSEYECLQDYVQIYFNLTAIKLEGQEEVLAELKICSVCVTKLLDFDGFRNLCLQVHWGLHRKSETELQHELETPNDGSVCKIEISEDEQWKNQFEEDYTDNPLENESESESEDSIIEPLPHKAESKSKNKPAKRGSKKKHQGSAELYSCDLCPKKFRVQLRLQAHKRTHDGLKPFECEQCGKVFSKLNNLKTHHVQKHTDNKIQLPCTHPGCDLKFTTQQALKRHRLKAHDPSYVAPEPEVFTCDTCDKSFTTNGALKNHKYIHMPNEMPFACNICSKKFPTSHKLKEHTMRHEGIKNHSCPICGLMKTTMHEVRTHIKLVHSKEKSYPCSDCDAVFSNSGNLKNHVNIIHLGLKPFTCPVCKRSFGKNDNLKRHMKGHILPIESSSKRLSTRRKPSSEEESEPIEPNVAEIEQIIGV